MSLAWPQIKGNYPQYLNISVDRFQHKATSSLNTHGQAKILRRKYDR